MTVTASEGADEIIEFLNNPTSANYSYLADLSTAFPYLTLPSLSTLALQHHLKEELLAQLGLYNFKSATYSKLAAIKRENNSGSHLIDQLEVYGYKSRAKLATKIAEKLGAPCLLLRFETLAQQRAPELREVMIYSEDIVGTSILKINGQKYFDAAVCNKTIIPVPRQPSSNHNALPQRTNFKAPYQYPNKSQHYSQQRANYPNRPPFRGHNQRGALFSENRGTNLRFRARGHQSNSRAPAPGNYKLNADSRKKTQPKPQSFYQY